MRCRRRRYQIDAPIRQDDLRVIQSFPVGFYLLAWLQYLALNASSCCVGITLFSQPGRPRIRKTDKTRRIVFIMDTRTGGYCSESQFVQSAALLFVHPFPAKPIPFVTIDGKNQDMSIRGLGLLTDQGPILTYQQGTI